MTSGSTSEMRAHALPALTASTDRMRVLAVVGTRPEAIKMFSPVRALQEQPDLFEVFLCSSGQHSELLTDALKTFGLTPDEDLAAMRYDQNPAEMLWTIGRWMSGLTRRLQPDFLLVQGDTATAMAAGLAGYFGAIPVAHIEAGVRSYDNHAPWPEEGTRRMLDAIADLHFAPTELAAANLVSEGVAPELIHVTGNTGIDALHWVLAQTSSTRGRRPVERRVVVTCHRRESVPDGLEAIGRSVRVLAQRYPDVRFQFVQHPSPAVARAISATLEWERPRNVELIPACDYVTFVNMLAEAYLILTDSGGIQEEAPVLGTPVLVVSSRTDRQEAVRAGTAAIVGTQAEDIVAATAELLDDRGRHARMTIQHDAFGDGRAGERIAAVLAELAIAGRRGALAESDRSLI
jgi:UDP-N-acetylglucosamine 2-epimerase (non-hydrolysing)